MKLNRKEFFSTLAGSAMGILGVKAKEPEIKVPQVVAEPYVEPPVRKMKLIIKNGADSYTGCYMYRDSVVFYPDKDNFILESATVKVKEFK